MEENKRIKKFNEISEEKLDISNVSESNIELINSSGLFFWNSNIDNKKKVEIIKWYNSLSDIEKKYVDILRNESYEDAVYDSNESEDY